MSFKWNYTEEQRKAVKNLDVSCNILKQGIKKLEAEKEGKSEVEVAALDAKIAYKQNRIVEKQVKKAEIQETAGQAERVVAPRKTKVGVEAAPTEVTAEM